MKDIIALQIILYIAGCHCHVLKFYFVALRNKSTAMVMAGRSVHLTTLFLGRLEQAVNQ